MFPPPNLTKFPWGKCIVPSLYLEKLRIRKVGGLPKVTYLVGDGIGIQSQGIWLQNAYFYLSKQHILPLCLWQMYSTHLPNVLSDYSIKSVWLGALKGMPCVGWYGWAWPRKRGGCKGRVPFQIPKTLMWYTHAVPHHMPITPAEL